MNKTLKNIFLTLLTAIAISGQLHAVKPAKEQENQPPIEHITEVVSLLDQIYEQAYIIVLALRNDNRALMAAKKKLRTFLTKLDAKTHEALSDTIKTIIDSNDMLVIGKTCHLLRRKIEAIKADAAVVETAQDAAIAVNAVSDELKPAVIAEQAQKVQEAEETAKQQSYLSRLKSHVFGDEVSWAKAAFYTAVGAAAIVGLYYGYQHNAEIGKAWQGLWKHKEVPLSDNQIKSIIETSDPILISLARDMMPLKELFLAFDAAHKNFEANPTTAKVLALNTIGTSLVSAVSNIQNEKPEYQKINTKQVDAVIEKIMKDWGIEK